MKFGLIGAGRIAETYAQALQDLAEAQLVAVADVRAEAAAALGARGGARAYPDAERLLADARADAVIVCTPPATHAEISRLAVTRGVHVLCEKPLCLDSATARDLLGAARSAGVVLSMASKFRFVGGVVRASELLADGLAGDVVLSRNVFTSRVAMAGRWNADSRLSGGGVLIDNGTHSVDLLRFLIGPLTEIQVVEGARVQALPVEDTVRAWVRSGTGTLGAFDLSWSLEDPLDTYVHVHGTRASLVVGWAESRYRLHGHREWVTFSAGYDKRQAFRGQLENFVRAIRGDEPLRVSGADALASVEAIEAGYASLRRGGWVPIGGTAPA